MADTLPASIGGFASLLDALHCGAVLIDRVGVIQYANDRLCAMMHRSPGDLVGQTILSLYATDADRDFVTKRLGQFDATHEGQFHVPTADGTLLPVIISGKPLGNAPPASDYRLITLTDISVMKKAEADRSEEIEVISRLSDTVLAQALDLKRHSEQLEQRVRERTKELHEANMEAIYMLAIASEAKDTDTGAHVRRIESLTLSIAETMGIPTGDSERIGYSAILHDVGKMLVPDSVLKKPGPLESHERDLMKLHAVGGERILSRKPFFELARQIARSHHENWDGSGYPDGLSGDTIPVAARIVHLADVYDALTSQRVYKDSWTPDEAIRVINEGSGRLFDPEVVRAFKSLVDSGKFSTLRT